jgi:homoserine kinase type II
MRDSILMAILTKMAKADFDSLLSRYDIGRYRSSKHIDYALENTNYIVNTTKGRFVLKIFEKVKESRLRFQISIEEYAHKRGIKTPRLMPSRKGQNIVRFKGKNVIVYEFVDGRHIKKMPPNLVRDLAQNVGFMHLQLLKCKIRPDSWAMADRLIHSYKARPKERWARMEFKRLDQELKSLDYNMIRKSMTHGDLAYLNLLCREGKLVAFLDWADTHRDFLVFDIAILITHCFMKKRGFDRRSTALFLKEYQKSIRINEEEKKALYYFIKVRCMGGILWCEMQLKSHPDKKESLQETISSIILQYKRLERQGLESFLQRF